MQITSSEPPQLIVFLESPYLNSLWHISFWSWMKDEHVIVIFKLWKMNIWYPNSWNSSKVMASNRGTVDNGFEEGPSPSSHKSEKIKKRYFQDCSSYKTGFILKLEASWKKSPIALTQQQANVNSSLNCLLIFFSAKLLQYWQTGKQRQAHYQVVSDFWFLHKTQIFWLWTYQMWQNNRII